MTSDDELLGNRSLSELEDAERRLRTHVKTRRRALRPSKARRIAGLFFSIPAITAGLALLYWSILTGHLLGLPAMIGPVLLVGGGMWLYSDWIE